MPVAGQAAEGHGTDCSWALAPRDFVGRVQVPQLTSVQVAFPQTSQSFSPFFFLNNHI